MATVTAIRVAPVKALAACLREEVHLDRDGVAEDRRLLLLNADGTVVTQRRVPQLSRVVPFLDLDAGTLAVTFPDGSTVTSDLRPGEVLRSRLFGKDREGRDVPGAVVDALSRYVGEPLRLVLAERIGVGWDEGPVSLISEASAAAVGTPGTGGEPPAARYRMTLELGGCAPYEEDSWVGQDVRIGAAQLRITHPLERCVVINRAATTGVPDWPGLSRLVAVRGRDRMTLGVIARVEAPGSVRVGDEIGFPGLA